MSLWQLFQVWAFLMMGLPIWLVTLMRLVWMGIRECGLPHEPLSCILASLVGQMGTSWRCSTHKHFGDACRMPA
jgi:hypothetical protein